MPLDYIRETRNQDVRAAAEAAIYSNAMTGKRAAETALQQAGIKPEQIGLVIAGGCSPDVVTPAEACSIAAELGIEANAMDLNTACSSFGSQIHFLSMMRPETLPDFILLISSENNTRTVNYYDRNTAVLWGDGSSAAVVSPRVAATARVSSTSLASSPKAWDKVLIPRTAHFEQEGATVQTFAIKRTVKCYREIKKEYPERKVFLVGHQANLRMLESVCSRCDIEEDLHLFNVDQYGNTGAAGAPTVLSQNWQNFKAGDVVAFIVVGAGLTWASLVLEFV